MTENELNEWIGRKIAEKEGRTICGCGYLAEWIFDTRQCVYCNGWVFPEYASDLNAVAEARRVLLDTNEKKKKFMNGLSGRTYPIYGHPDLNRFVLLDAPALEQCRAIYEALK